MFISSCIIGGALVVWPGIEREFIDVDCDCSLFPNSRGYLSCGEHPPENVLMNTFALF